MEMKNRLMAVAAIAALAQGGAAMNNSLGRRVFPRISARRPSKRYPQMVTSTAEEIREHNRNVNTRQVLRRNFVIEQKQGASAEKASYRRTRAA